LWQVQEKWARGAGNHSDATQRNPFISNSATATLAPFYKPFIALILIFAFRRLFAVEHANKNVGWPRPRATSDQPPATSNDPQGVTIVAAAVAVFGLDGPAGKSSDDHNDGDECARNKLPLFLSRQF
jgi:hypothetical protein